MRVLKHFMNTWVFPVRWLKERKYCHWSHAVRNAWNQLCWGTDSSCPCSGSSAGCDGRVSWLFFHNFMTSYHQPMSLFGNRLMLERGWYANRNISVGAAHSWNGLGVVILRGNLGSHSSSWTSKNSLWCGRRKNGSKEAGGERMPVPEKWSTTVLSLWSPQLFLPLEMVIVPNRLWHSEKKKLVCVQGARMQKIALLYVNLVWKFITKRCMVISSVEFGSEALRGIAKYLSASPHRLV